MKVLKIFLILLASLLMGAIVWFIDNASIVDMIAGTYAIVVNAFLGIDLASMIKDSSKLKPGDHKDIKLYRYVISFICMMILFGLSLYRKEVSNIDAIMAISAFGSGSMLIIGLVLGGLGGNKIASRGGPDDTSTDN